jgi:hypothetical protein
MKEKLQKNSVQTRSFLSFTKMMFSAMLILAFSFTAQKAVAQKNVVAGLLPTISVDSLAGKTNSSRIYITDGVDYDSLPERVANFIPQRWMSVAPVTLPVTVDFTFPTTTLTGADVCSGWYEYAGSTGNGSQFTNLSMQTFDGFGWNDIPADTTRFYGGLAIHFHFTSPVTSDHIRLNIKGLASDAGNRVKIDEIKVWDNSVNGLLSTKANATLSTFPNPVKDMLYVNLDNQSNYNEIEILNLTGKVLKTQQVNGAKLVSIDTRDLSGGVYICRTKSGSDVKTAKIVKQ